MQNSWAPVGPIDLMGRLLARVKSVSVAPKKNVAIADHSSEYHHYFPNVEYQKDIFCPKSLNYPTKKVGRALIYAVQNYPIG
jgi:hypothetical protein